MTLYPNVFDPTGAIVRFGCDAIVPLATCCLTLWIFDRIERTAGHVTVIVLAFTAGGRIGRWAAGRLLERLFGPDGRDHFNNVRFDQDAR